MLDILKRMRDRVKRDSQDSDAAAYAATLYELELVVKLTVCALIACIRPDREGHHYRQAHELVRADSVGKYAPIADEILTGPTSRFLYTQAQTYVRELTQNSDKRSWQYSACEGLVDALRLINETPDELPAKVQGRRWLSLAAQYRNASLRGHGVDTQAQMAKVCGVLNKSIKAFTERSSLFSSQWGYIHRTMSGKYRIVDLGCGVDLFAALRSDKTSYGDGIYVAFDEKTFSEIEFIQTDVDLSDYFLPNGAFNNKRYQAVSYLSGSKRTVDASPYLRPATELPKSETHGEISLDLIGNTFSNIPPENADYIPRPDYEKDLLKVLSGETHPIVTLSGRGGIGKTSLALRALHEIAAAGGYFAIVWFSARDIDLVATGAKTVKPAVLSTADVAKEFVGFFGLENGRINQSRARELLSQQLTSSEVGPLLLVLDNFETFVDAADLFAFLDTFVRPPNKILITSRERIHFRGDYAIAVGGMEDDEAQRLIDVTSIRLQIPAKTLSSSYKDELIKESAGHPYIIKFLLAEVARGRKPTKVERILASDDAMLQALFERTYATLTPAAKRVFLTLCNWRSHVFRIALESVLLRPQNDRIEPSTIDALLLSSFVETTEPMPGRQELLSVPLVAQIFGKGKLAISPHRKIIDEDTRILQLFGALQSTDQPGEFDARLRRVVGRLGEDPAALLPILEAIGSRHAIVWSYLSEYYAEHDDFVSAKSYLERFIERALDSDQRIIGWQKFVSLTHRMGDQLEEVRGLAELASVASAPVTEISAAVHSLNGIFSANPRILESDEKRAIINHVADVFHARIADGDATDRSRLSWLYQKLGNRRAALEMAAQGVRDDDKNVHCRKILESATAAERIRYNLG